MMVSTQAREFTTNDTHVEYLLLDRAKVEYGKSRESASRRNIHDHALLPLTFVRMDTDHCVRDDAFQGQAFLDGRRPGT